MALKEYKKLLRKTREQHENRQSADNRDNPPRLQRPTRVADVNTTGKVCLSRTCKFLVIYQKSEWP